VKFLTSIIQLLVNKIYRSKFIAQLIFHINFPDIEPHDYYFDVTTLALYKKVTPRLDKNNIVLDLGTGPHAILGLSFLKKVGCKVICADVNLDLVKLAKKNVTYNHESIKVVESNFFNKINSPFDTIVFNTPYIPTQTGKSWNLPDKRSSQWDGGNRGTNVIDLFLEAMEKNKNSLTAYLGINSMFVPKSDILYLLKKHRGLTLTQIIKSIILPTDIYVIHNLKERR